MGTFYDHDDVGDKQSWADGHDCDSPPDDEIVNEVGIACIVIV